MRSGVATTRRLRVATYVGAISVVLSLIGFLRWVFVVPPLAASYVSGSATTKAAVDAAWTAQHQYGGALLGEHLGQLLVIGWSVTLSVVIVRTRVMPRWLGVAGLVVSALYLLNQGDILATAVPGFPVFDLAGLIGSTTWGLWVVVLGVMLLRARSVPFLPMAPPWNPTWVLPTYLRPEHLLRPSRKRPAREAERRAAREPWRRDCRPASHGLGHRRMSTWRRPSTRR